MGTRRSILFAVVAVLAVVGAGPARALASGVATVAGGGAVDVAALNAGLR